MKRCKFLQRSSRSKCLCCIWGRKGGFPEDNSQYSATTIDFTQYVSLCLPSIFPATPSPEKAKRWYIYDIFSPCFLLTQKLLLLCGSDCKRFIRRRATSASPSLGPEMFRAWSELMLNNAPPHRMTRRRVVDCRCLRRSHLSGEDRFPSVRRAAILQC